MLNVSWFRKFVSSAFQVSQKMLRSMSSGLVFFVGVITSSCSVMSMVISSAFSSVMVGVNWWVDVFWLRLQPRRKPRIGRIRKSTKRMLRS